MENRVFAFGIACLMAAVPAGGIAGVLLPVVDIAPNGFSGAPPLMAVLPPYEIIASVRSAGFDPLSRPLQRGGVYVVFATDRYDVEVRVVVDARSGRILGATRLAGEIYDEPRSDGFGGPPRAMPPGYPPPYERPPQLYELPPLPPADVPGAGPGYGRPRVEGLMEDGDARLRLRERSRTSEESGRRAPAVSASRLPSRHARPGDVPTVAVTASPQTVAPPAPAELQAPPPAAQSPSMVPVAPLD